MGHWGVFKGIVCAAICLVWLGPSWAQIGPDSGAPVGRAPAGSAAQPGDQKAELKTGEKLALQQQAIADKFKRLEEVLLRMAELTSSTDPRRASLLRRVVAQSKDRLIGAQFDRLVELIQKDQLAPAIAGQEELDRDLRALLELLLSENRAKQLESEKARLREFLKRLSEIIKQQKGIQGQTGGTGEPKRLAADQARLADRTGQLAKDVKANQSQKDATAGQVPPEGKQPEKTATPGKSGDADGKPKPSDKPSSQGKGQAKSQKDGQQGQGQGDAQEQSQTPSKQAPAHQRLEAAQQRMREAQKRLEQAQRKQAIDEQEEAIRQLEQARADLQRILRQLREEEMERTLAALEARVLKMLQMQRAVYDATVRLEKMSQSQGKENLEIESGRLSSKEAQIVLEADKAMLLLREDGTAVAFPEALGQAKADMQQVVDRLARTNVDQITQGIEQDIISALEEMLQALQQARKDLEDRRQRPPPSEGQPRDPPLVDVLAELKMIRTLQVRVRTRTARYSKLVEGEQARNAELIEALRQLAERQRQIHRITRDLEMGKNR